MPIRRSPNGAGYTHPQPGRDRPEWVVAINRNGSSQSIVIGGRNQPVRPDGDHGRIETRNYTVIHDVDWLQARHQWPGLKAVVVVESRREINGKITDETRFYITSLVMLAAAVGPTIRAHWDIEN